MVTASQYYICNKCHFRTKLFSKIDDHLLIHHDTKQHSPLSCFDTLKPLKCTSCDFRTESLVLLRYHLVCNHNQQQFALKTELKKCKKCGFCTHSNYLWIRHPIFGTCKSKKQSKEKKKRGAVLWKRDGKWYLCENCDYRTDHSDHLKNHVIYKHTPLADIDWQHCKKCHAKYKTIHGLKKHQKYVHGSAVDHLNCPECDYSTPSRYHLERHFNRKHARPEEIKWVECHKCGAKYKDKDKLKRHLVRHTTKEKQFKCDQCSFETRQKINLKTHIVNRHLKDEEVNWSKCQHCSFKTKRNRVLKAHVMKYHDDSIFKCDLCNYRAKLEKTIEIHKKNKHENNCVVGDVKLLKCEHCNYSCKLKHNLKYHILAKHNIDGEVFQCKQCDYKTHSKAYLTGHITRMHKRDYTEEEKLNCSHCSYFCFNKLYLKKHLNLHLSLKQLSWNTKIP